MNTADGYAHSANIHYKTAVSVDADDIAFQSCQFATGDTEQDAVAGIVMEWFEQETNTLWFCLIDTHKGAHL